MDRLINPSEMSIVSLQAGNSLGSPISRIKIPFRRRADDIAWLEERIKPPRALLEADRRCSRRGSRESSVVSA
jgi:hypothetical protein